METPWILNSEPEVSETCTDFTTKIWEPTKFDPLEICAVAGQSTCEIMLDPHVQHENRL